MNNTHRIEKLEATLHRVLEWCEQESPNFEIDADAIRVVLNPQKQGVSHRLSSEDWDDVADLLSQFAQQCEIAFEEHRPNAKRWLARRLQAQAMTAQGKVANDEASNRQR